MYYQTNVQNIPGEANNSVLSDINVQNIPGETNNSVLSDKRPEHPRWGEQQCTIRQTSRTSQVRLITVYYQTNVQNIPGEANNSVLSDKRPEHPRWD